MSYWCGAQLVVTIDGPAGRSVVSLAQPFARVGSHPTADVNIPDETVAPRCLYLHATLEGVFCLYLDVANQDLAQKGKWLAPDEEIAVGPYRVRASLLTAEADDSLPTQGLAAWGSAPPPLPVMLVYCGERLKDKRRFRARLSPVGRRPQCALQLKGQKVSGFHCVLFWEREQLWCVDLNSSNGTQLNGEPLDCGRVSIGDRLDVGEFALVFQRLSSGRSPAGEADAGGSPRRVGQKRARGGSDEGDQPERDLATQVAVPRAAPTANRGEAPAPPPAPPPAPIPPEPSPEDLVREAENRNVREQLAAEVAQLAREREQLHSQWEQTSQQLLSQIGQLHDEGSRLTGERQALEQSRQEWQGERAALTEQLAERSNQMARLEAELAAATATLAERLAQIDQRATPLPPAPAPEPPGPSPADLAREEENRRLREQMTAEVATLARDRHDLQALWDQSSKQLVDQIGQLRDEASRLTGEREALEQSRHQWHDEQAALSEQLTQRSDQLARLEADLAAATATLAQKIAQVEERPAPPPAATISAAAPDPTPIAAAVQPVFVEAAPEPDPAAADQAVEDDLPTTDAVLDSFAPPEPAEPAPDDVQRPTLADRDQLPQFVSDRLLDLDHTQRRQQLLWWSAGGVGVVVLAALAATVLLWIF